MNPQPFTIWLTGLSGAGKTTLAYAIKDRLIEFGLATYVLDGDNLRDGLSADLGFSYEDRVENIRRSAEVAKLMNCAGLIVIASFISPTHASRELSKNIIGEDQFFEVYLSTPIEVCEARDPKGLYVRARAGILKDFTGVSAIYEPPSSPWLTFDTSQHCIAECVDQITSKFF